MEFKVGDKVKLRKNSRWYGNPNDFGNPMEAVGHHFLYKPPR